MVFFISLRRYCRLTKPWENPRILSWGDAWANNILLNKNGMSFTHKQKKLFKF